MPARLPGRPRTKNAHIPTHIDQSAIPRGLYWNGTGSGRWYVLDYSSGKRRAVVVAQRDARLSELHLILEERSRGSTSPSTLRALAAKYHGSPEFAALKATTRQDYEYSRARVLEVTTKVGCFGELQPHRISRPVVQRLIDQIAAGRSLDKNGKLVRTPSTAAHALRWLRVLFRWGANRGFAPEANPAQGVEPPKERKQRRLPTHEAIEAVLSYARTHGDGTRGKQGSVAAYLWPAAEIAYLCRLRGIEVVCDLTDADVSPVGLRGERRKGSLTNITRWDDRLRMAYNALVTYRESRWRKMRRAVPMRPEDRTLVVGTNGEPVTKDAFDSAWQRMMRAALKAGVIDSADRFSMHDLKRRGVTDTTGTRGEKQQASGHRSEAMLDVYDLDVPIVDSAATSRARKPTS